MDYFLSEDQTSIRDLARRIAEERVVPVRAELDEKEEFPWGPLKYLAEVGLFGVYIPEAYGGLGYGSFENCLAIEELSRACIGVSVSFAASGLGSYPILLFGSEEQKKKYLPDVASGKKLAAFGLTEAGAGSDAGGIRTTARKEGDFYLLNGTKQWITNGGEAETYSVIALTDKSKGPRGASAFIVEKGMPGFNFGKKEKKLGIRCSATRELVFEDCRVPKENLISREGMGFVVAMRTLDKTRPGIGAQAVGLAQGAFEAAVAYAKDRHQFEKPIISFQAVQHMLADMAAQIEAARALVYAVARWVDTNPKDVSKYSAISKLFPSDVAMKVTVDAVQIFGGYGFMRDYPVEKMMRDAKILQIYEGTNQVQRNVIGQALIKEQAGKMKKVALVFPGQGSQYVGMGKDFFDRSPAAREVFGAANEALGYDLSALCFRGPEEDLKLTANTQPAILATSIAVLRAMQSEKEILPVAAAGHSLGEYGALVASGALRFPDAVRLVHLRGKFMQEAVPVGVGAIAAVMGMSPSEVEDLCRETSAGEILSPANYNCPGQIAIAGHRTAVQRALERVAGQPGKKAVLLPVSAPFHCALMSPAGERLREELAKTEVSDLHFPVLSNAEADFYPGKENIRELLVKQVDHPVRWEECMHKLVQTGADLVLEVGPGKVLSGLMRRISREVKTANVEDGPSWEKAKELLKGN